MKIECPRCKSNFRINDNDIPNGGAPVECIECSNIFTIFVEPLSIVMVRIDKEEEDIGLQALHEDAELVQDSEFKQDFAGIQENQGFTGEVEKPYSQPSVIIKDKVKQDIPEFEYTGEKQREEIYSSKSDLKKSYTGLDSQVDFEKTKMKQETLGYQVEGSKRDFGQENHENIEKLEPEMPEVDLIKDEPEASTSLEDFFNISKTPEDQAITKAKNIIKELKLYFPDASAKAASTGKVPDNLVVEIKKALQYYKSEVVEDVDWKVAMSYFRDSINEIIGEGKKLFK